MDTIFSYYLRNRPLFLSFIRTKEIELLRQNAILQGLTLDFGCGDGFFMQALTMFAQNIFKNTKIIGVDVNKKIVTRPCYSKIIDYNGLELPFKSNTFNTVFSNCVLEHLPYLDKNLLEMHRVLKPKGKLVATVMAEPWNRFTFFPSSFWRKAQIHHNLLTYSEWTERFEKAGFKVLKKIGYLNKAQSRFIEFSHFLSLPYLLSYTLLGKWETFGSLYNALLPKESVVPILAPQSKLADSAALFFILQKL